MGKSRIADSIMREYDRKKRYEAKIQRKELEKFMKENCLKCKNSNTKLCHIVKNVDNKFSCPFKTL